MKLLMIFFLLTLASCSMFHHKRHAEVVEDCVNSFVDKDVPMDMATRGCLDIHQNVNAPVRE